MNPTEPEIRRRDVDSRLLRTFVAVAQEASFTRAAASLGMTQQSISGHIKRLEGIFGMTLFERHSSGADLTPAGNNILAYAVQVLTAADALFDRAAGMDRPIRLAEIRNRKLMQEVWKEHRQHRPADRASFLDLTGDEQVSALMGGQIDVAMHTAAQAEPRLTQALLLLDPVKLLYIRPLTDPALRGQRVGYAAVGTRYPGWQRFCMRLAPEFGVKLELVPHDITMLEAIGQQMIQGDVPPMLVLEGMEQYAEAEHFYFHHLSDVQPYYPWVISIRRDEKRPEVLAFFQTALEVSSRKGWLKPVRPGVPQWLPPDVNEDAKTYFDDTSGFRLVPH